MSVTCDLPAALRARLGQIAASRGLSVAAAVRESVAAWCDAEERADP